jgi:SAM-dependent methyltransferase
MSATHDHVIRAAIDDAQTFVRATFTQPQSQAQGHQTWVRVVIRPVVLKGKRHLQFSRFTKDKDLTKNYTGTAASRELTALLRVGFRDIQIQTTFERIHVRVDRDGTPRIRRRPRPVVVAPDVAHDRPKRLALGADSHAFLHHMGIVNALGAPKPGLARKHKQVNEFVRLLAQVPDELPSLEGRRLVIADLGCGNALLTFAAYHYLNDVRGIPSRLFGVDLKSELIARHQALADALGWNHVTFYAGRIAKFQAPEQPDIVLALHACDTATDEALAQGIEWNSRVILSVPCCHHHLQAQLAGRDPPSPLAPVFRHGILRERWADVITDTFRAQILRIMGYRTDVIEFVSPEHTTRNLLIRAVRSAEPGQRDAVEDYLALRQYCGVAPYLEELLGPALRTARGDARAETVTAMHEPHR